MMISGIGNNRDFRGFTLIEVMLAAAILGSAVTIIFQGFFMSLNSGGYLVNRMAAGILASNRAWEVQDSLRHNTGMPSMVTSAEEVSNGTRFNWTVTSKTLDPEYGLYEADIKYSWDQNNRQPNIKSVIYILK